MSECDFAKWDGECGDCPYQVECEEHCLDMEEEAELERQCTYAGDCQCGAWQFINGRPVHVADCVCGAQ